MNRLAVAYQDERQDLTSGDLTALVIQALVRCVGRGTRQALYR